MANFFGTTGTDTHLGDATDQLIQGYPNGGSPDTDIGDTLSGADGNDTIDGGAGVDTLDGGAGSDTINGSLDNDFVTYATAPGAVSVTLGAQTATDGWGSVDVLQSIENVIGSNFNDVILGSDPAVNSLYGADGDDRLVAFGGGDRLYGGAGNDTLEGNAASTAAFDLLEGGAGNDTYLVDHVTDSVVELANSGIDRVVAYHTDFTLSDNVEVLDFVSTAGRQGQGNTLANTITGSGGGDWLRGNDGNDTLYGDAAGDTLDGEQGDDTLYGGVDVDTLIGNNGNDLMYADAGPASTAFGGNGNDTFYGGDGADFAQGISDNDLFYGGGGADTLDGGTESDILYGEGEADTLFGGDADDALFGGDGSDELEGGFGNDYLAGGAAGDTAFGDLGDDTILGEDGEDTLVGDDGDDLINGGANGDVVDGGVGNDTLSGEAGDDSLSGGSDQDRIFGGDGNDLIQGGAGSDTIEGAGDADTIDGGTESDTIYGGLAEDTLSGGEGNDNLFGDAAVDTLYGGNGDDIIESGGGADTMYGGAGDDRFRFQLDDASAAAPDLILDFTGAGVAGGDLIDLSPLFNQPLAFMGFRSFTFNGLGGNSGIVLPLEWVGDGVIDVIYDTFAGQTRIFVDIDDDGQFGESDQFIYLNGTHNLVVGDFADDFPVFKGTGNDDVINTGANNNTVFALAGNDTVDSGDGNDVVRAAAGNDTAYGGTGHESLFGEAGDDRLFGGTGTDRIEGADGNDTIYGGDDDDRPNLDAFGNLWGGEGNDLMYGGLGNDWADGENGDDRVFGDAGDDALNGGNGLDTLYGGADNDILNDASGNSTLYGDSGDDSVFGGNGQDVVFGGTGNDTVAGSNFSDTVYGGDGDDVVISDDSNDTLYGGAGNDRFTLSAIYQWGDYGPPVIVDVFGDFEGAGAVGGDVIVLPNPVNGSSNPYFLPFAFVGAQSFVPTMGSALPNGGDGLADVMYTVSGGTLWLVIDRDDSGELSTEDTMIAFSGISVLGAGDFDDGTFIAVTLGSGNESYLGGGANDTIFGLAGNDTIESAAGFDSVYGGPGNDTLYGGDEKDWLYGGDGRDGLFGGNGSDTAYGGADNDTIVDSNGFDVVFGDDGNDTVSTGDENDTIYGGSGIDSVSAGDGQDTLYGGDDADSLSGGNDNDRIEDQTGVNTLLGDGGDDFIDGSGTLYGGAGNDTLRMAFQATAFGGADADVFRWWNPTFAANGTIGDFDANDLLNLDFGLEARIFAGEQSFDLTEGAAVPFGGDGFIDVFYRVQSGNLHLAMDRNDDGVLDQGEYLGVLLGVTSLTRGDFIPGTFNAVKLTNGADSYTGEAGSDTIYAVGGNDTVFSNDGTNIEPGDNSIYGGLGNDTLDGAGGDNPDVFYGDDGDDVLQGRGGSDGLLGGAGNDTLYGGADDDFSFYNGVFTQPALRGGDGDDTIYAGAGIDWLLGEDGNDALHGDSGNDAIEGGAGTDTLYGGDGNDGLDGRLDNDVVFGGANDDNLIGDAGDDTLYGGDDNDRLWGSAGNDTYYGGAGNDELDLDSGTEVAFGGAGDDTFTAGNIFAASFSDRIGDFEGAGVAGGDLLNLPFYEYYHFLGQSSFTPTDGSALARGGDGIRDVMYTVSGGTLYLAADVDDNGTLSADTDVLVALSGINTLSAGDFVPDTFRITRLTDGVDSYTGAVGADTIFALAGNDSIDGNDGSNLIYGGLGNDSVIGGVDFDFLHGGDGDDVIVGDDGSDRMVGNAGNDTIYGGEGSDYFFSVGYGLYGGEGDDALYGGFGVDFLDGDSGEDRLEGGADGDFLSGGDNNDMLLGQDGVDVLSGGEGNDTLEGGSGIDTLTGGGGNDVFVYRPGPTGTGTDDILDFLNGNDRVDVSAFGYTSIADITAAGGSFVQDGNWAVLTLATGDQPVVVRFWNIDINQLTPSRFIFVGAAGSNEGPTAVADTNSGDAVVEAGVDPGNTAFAGDTTATGNVLTNDTDPNEEDTKTVTTTGTFGGTYGSLTLAANGTWTYTLNNADSDTNALAGSQSVTDVFNYTMQDSFGLTSSSTVTISITGTNDLPTAVADTNAGDAVIEVGVNPGNTPVAGDVDATGNVLDNDTDIDTGDSQFVTTTGTFFGTYGVLNLSSNGAWYYALDNSGATNALTQGQSVVDVFNYTMQDGWGATSSSTLTITVTGTNDQPTAVADTNGSDAVIEAGTNPDGSAFAGDASAVGNVLTNDTDVDTGDTKTVTTTGSFTGTYGTLTLSANGAWSYALDNSDPDTNALAQGQAVNDVFNYTMRDTNGATSSSTLSIGITGTSDLSGFTVIESSGATGLSTNGTNYYFVVGGSLGPTLKQSGAAVTPGQFGAWTPIGVESTHSFDVMWRFGSTDQFITWHTDNSGNMVSIGAVMSGGSYALQEFEAVFQQDFNQDGTTGLRTVVIETDGAIDLVQKADRFFFGDSGPTLKQGGAVVTAGQFGAWVPIGVEAAAGGGYYVVWKFGTASQYVAWHTDSSGNMLSMSDVFTGSSDELKALETLFSQDFNHDGTTGVALTTIETAGATDLSIGAGRYFLQTGIALGPIVEYLGEPVTVGQFGAWTPLGAEASAGGGYDVVWKFGSADQYIAWHLDSTGETTSIGSVMTGNSYALQELEASLGQDFNSDGTTGLRTTTIEIAGATALLATADRYVFGTGGPTLKYLGAVVTAGQFGAWTPLGVEAVAGGGYDVVWKFGTADQYVVWRTDSTGNMTSIGAPMSGGSYAFQEIEASLGQDFNADGTTGLRTTVLETGGTIDLVQKADRFFFGNSGPTLQYFGAPVTSGQFGAWTPIGVEAAGGGYDVVWKFGSAEQYIVWRTDSSGNMTSIGSTMTGSSTELRVWETVLDQDLNNNGTTGFTTSVIEVDGLTDLLTGGNRYFLEEGGSPAAAIRFQGADVVAGQFGAWTPIGAEASAGGGYDVVWKFGSADQYIAWHLDGGGNMTSIGGTMTGASDEMRVWETLFAQDLNSDSTTGVVTTAIEAAGATGLRTGANRYFLEDGGAPGPTIKFQGADVVAGQFGAWTPIGAEAAAGGGYDVVWKFGSADQYIAWHLDASGNMTSIGSTMTGSSNPMRVWETLFTQDLNSNGTTGVSLTAIETAGVTGLRSGASRFFLDDGGAPGPTIKYQGADVVADQFGAWTPLGAEAAAGGGFDVVWKFGSADQYIAWHLDASGAMTSIGGTMTGNSATLLALETQFNQDFNGSGFIG